MATIGSLIVKIGADIQDLKNGLKNSEGLVSKATQKLGGIGKTLGKGAAAGALGAAAAIGAVGSAAAGVGAVALDTANQVDTATAQIAGGLGIAKEEAAAYEDTMKSIFANNFGENFEDIADTIITVEKQLEGLDDKGLQKVSEGALAIRDNFDKDVAETVDATDVLMEEFGLTGEQALDFITKGLQEGLDRNGDFLDSIREYGNLFGSAEARADEFFSVLESGAQGGVLGTDKAADAFKEFQIRFLEGGSAVEEAFEAMGQNWQDWANDAATGDFRVTDAFTDIISEINKIEDPIERNRVGVALLGTQFEDLGADAALGISTTTTKIEDMAGATDSLNARYDNLGDALGGLKRKALVALEPLGSGMLDAINQSMPDIINLFDNVLGPAIQKFGAGAGPIFSDFAEKLSKTIGPAMELINDALKRINIALGGTGEKTDIVNVALGVLQGLLDAVIFGIQATAIAFQGIAWAIEQVTAGIKTVMGWFDSLGDKMGGLGDKIPDWLKPGSPPPLAFALRDIKRGLQALPSMDEAFGFSGGSPMALAGVGGDGNSSITVNIGDVSATATTDGDPVEEVIRMVVELLEKYLRRGS